MWRSNPVGGTQAFPFGMGSSNRKGDFTHMHPHITMEPVIAIVAGLAILFQPRLLNYIVALYLLFTGVVHLLR